MRFAAWHKLKQPGQHFKHTFRETLVVEGRRRSLCPCGLLHFVSLFQTLSGVLQQLPLSQFTFLLDWLVYWRLNFLGRAHCGLCSSWPLSLRRHLLSDIASHGDPQWGAVWRNSMHTGGANESCSLFNNVTHLFDPFVWSLKILRKSCLDLVLHTRCHLSGLILPNQGCPGVPLCVAPLSMFIPNPKAYIPR